MRTMIFAAPYTTTTTSNKLSIKRVPCFFAVPYTTKQATSSLSNAYRAHLPHTYI